jgi:hypothetical protein
MSFDEQILTQLAPTYIDEIAQDYVELVNDVGEYITVWNRVLQKDRMNRDVVEFVFGDTIRGIVVLRNVVMQYGHAGQTDIQQSFIMSDVKLNQRDRIEHNNLAYEIERVIVMGNVYMHYIKELANG